MKKKGETIDEEIQGGNIIYMNNIYKLLKSTIKIIISTGGVGTGFFIKFQRNNKNFYCFMTNQHVIKPKMIENKESIAIYYKNESKTLILSLNTTERLIFCLEKDYNVDVTIVEIIPKDNVNDSYFLIPCYNEKIESFEYEQYFNKKIQIIQYPKGDKLSYSEGIISGCDPKSNIHIFLHTCETRKGSSGGPIVLKGEERVIGIHKGKIRDTSENVGIFIGMVFSVLKFYKKNGYFVEYYENGDIKYEGKLKDDEYNDDNAKFVYPNGDFYMGPFKDGKKEGKGIEYYKNCQVKYEGNFSNDNYNGKDGRFYYENGNCFIGEFQNGKKHGQGYIVNENNAIEKEGTFEDDEFVEGTDFNTKVNKIKSFFGAVKSKTTHAFNPLINYLGIKCKKCDHLLKSHEELTEGCLICNECPKNDNLCKSK